MRNGGDYWLPDGANTFENVYSVMLVQVLREYSGLGDFRSLKAHELRFFYDALKPELKRQTDK